MDHHYHTGKADDLIRASGCGPFQVLVVLLVSVANKFTASFSTMFMAFGIYNPGWRCADDIVNNTLSIFRNISTFNVTESRTNNFEVSSALANETSSNPDVYPHKTESCAIFKACQNVEFDPQTSTIVTEWGLVCDGAWIPSVIISIQMVGVLLGCFVSGQLGDTLGRKITLYCALALNSVFNIVSIFSPNWQVFAALKFLIGMSLGCVFNLAWVLPSEYLTNQWRSRVAIFPFWHVGGIVFSVAAMLCQDWRTMHVIGGAMSLASCLSCLWVPESLRWLEVKKKYDKFEQVARKMTSLNKVTCDINLCDRAMLPKIENTSPTKIYTILDIFRKGFRMYSFIIGFLWLVPSLIYYAIGFGVKAMYGNFYINLIIVFAIDIPFTIFPLIALNKLGRRTVCVLFLSIATVCLLAAAGIDLWASMEIKQTGSFVLALLGKLTTNAGLAAIIVMTGEIYPTVVRSIGNGYANFVCRFGGVAAPFLIPQDMESFYICYGIMGLLCLASCLFVMKLPETKGRELKEYFDEEDED